MLAPNGSLTRSVRLSRLAKQRGGKRGLSLETRLPPRCFASLTAASRRPFGALQLVSPWYRHPCVKAVSMSSVSSVVNTVI
jgi:hypothetical protein